MKVLVAMSGGVDSSVAAAELRREGHEVVGVTMRLWGGESDTGCCSVSDVDDARRVAQQLRIDHLVFNFSEEFNDAVVAPYVDAHRHGTTPNPCIECNRHLKFDRLSQRARLLGFDAVATGHHARIERQPSGVWRVARGADTAKDQSYVVHMLDQRELAYTLFPVGHLTKAQVRERAEELGLRTAAKPDSQDVCFISKTGGRETFLGHRIPFRRGRVLDESGNELGAVDAVELVTIGQRRGLRLPGGSPKQFVLEVDVARGTVVVGDEARLAREEIRVGAAMWSHEPPPLGSTVMVQTSAHGAAHAAVLEEVVSGASSHGSFIVRLREPQRRTAPGQSVVLYDIDNRLVLGGGIAS
ncbi:MAG: tRNA 2-thiouridine(34) synthase MnmA [Actinomycetota bacterium]